ncbi:MAG TPA: hypothetical protein VD735_04860 [Candidatus Saccharimonadales bacterium]|nr:hypothetical protein [Candidatus Saccharimonadales bacterium]
MDRHTQQLMKLLILPSWISGIIGTVLALGIVIALLFQGRYEGSELQQQYLNWQIAGGSQTLGGAAGSLQQNTAELVNVLVLYIFWFAVGTVIYLIISAIYTTVQSAREAREQLTYVNVAPGAHLRTIIRRVVLRTAWLAVWAVYTIATLKVAIPYLLGAVHIGDARFPSVGSVVLLALATGGLFLVIHLHVVVLRLFLGRPRIFNGSEYLITSSNH